MLYIRRATAQDAQTIAAIQGEAWRQAYRELLPPESLEKLGSTEYWLEYWEKELKAPQADHYIALEGFQAVGFFSLGEPRDEDREEGSRELLLIKMRNDPAVRNDIRSASTAYEGKVVDYTKESIIIQMVGDSRKIDNFIDLMRDFEIMEICRTGLVTLQRGATTIRRVTNL